MGALKKVSDFIENRYEKSSYTCNDIIKSLRQ